MDEMLSNMPEYIAKGIGAYTALLFGVQALSTLFSQRIKSQNDLDSVVNEEAKKLCINPREVLGDFYEKRTQRYKEILGSRCTIEDVEEGEVLVHLKILEIKEGWGARRSSVRHELYHLKNNFPRPKNPIVRFLRGFFYEEPTATLYETTGIKL